MVMEFGHFELVVCLAVWLPLSGLSLADVLVDPQTQGVLGRPVTLPCRFVGAGQVIQVTWLKLTELGPQMVAARSLEHGTSTHPFYGARAHFLAPSSDPDASLVIREAALTDGGTFRCAIVTFPAGNFEKDTRLTVLVPPQASVVPGPRALLEGDRDALAATCTATGSSPPATVRWESAVPGAQEEVASHNANGTVTISSSFYLDPVRAMQGHRLSCLVNHSTFSRPTRLEHTLNIYYVPEVTVSKSSENWHVGMDNAELTCQENGNPPASGFVWRRLDGSLPNNSVTEGNRLLFQSSLSADDAGTYICEAKNTIGSRTGQTDIKIIDADVPSVNMLSMAFVAIGAVGVLLLLILVVSIIAVNRYHKNKTEQMVFKLEEISTMSRQPSIRRCNSMSASVDARLQDGGGSRENVLEQEPMLQEALAQQAQQLRNSTRELRPVNGEGTLPPSAFGNHRYSLRSTTSEMTQAPPAYQFGAFRYSLNSSLRPIGRDRTVGPGSRTLPPPIPLNNHRDSTTEMVETPEQMEILSRRTLTPSPSVLDSQTEDEDEVTDRQQSIQAAMGHFYSHNGTLRAKPTGNGIYIARREHCV